MKHSVCRRDFLAASAAAGIGLWAHNATQAAPYKTTLKKAMIRKPNAAEMKSLKEAGFDGMETSDWDVSPDEAAQAPAQARKIGVEIHSVLFGWANFNQPDKFDQDIANVKKALQATQGYGASALLLVPCRIKTAAMPEAWEFDLDFDEKTGHLKHVVAGDNAKYAAYIAAHNQATDASRKAVEMLIPTAEKTGVILALENVWNNLWVKPAFFANFVNSFANRWVQTYFDIGNHVKYAPPEEWIRALGKTIVKLHVKDFKLNPDGHGGKFVHPRDGSVELAPGAPGTREDRLQRVDDDRGRRPGTRRVQPPLGLDHRRQIRKRDPDHETANLLCMVTGGGMRRRGLDGLGCGTGKETDPRRHHRPGHFARPRFHRRHQRPQGHRRSGRRRGRGRLSRRQPRPPRQSGPRAGVHGEAPRRWASRSCPRSRNS